MTAAPVKKYKWHGFECNESKDDEGIEPLVANVLGRVEERVARSTRDAKGSRPTIQPLKQDLNVGMRRAGNMTRQEATKAMGQRRHTWAISHGR